MIYKAHKIYFFKQVEIFIDFFGYNLEKEGNNFYLKINNFERARINGYSKFEARHQSQIVQAYREEKEIAPNEMQLFEQIYDFYKENNFPIYKVMHEPFTRIVLSLIVDDNAKLNLFQIDKLSFEDITFLKILTNENYNHFSIEKGLINNINCYDILIVQRVLRFINFVYHKAIQEEKNNYPKSNLAIQSILPVFKLEQLVFLLHQFTLLSKSDCKSIIDRITNKLNSFDDYEDLQYKPILAIDDWYLLLPSVLSYSNLIRSIAIDEKKHLSSFEGNDYMIENVKSSFKEQGFQAGQPQTITK